MMRPVGNITIRQITMVTVDMKGMVTIMYTIPQTSIRPVSLKQQNIFRTWKKNYLMGTNTKITTEVYTSDMEHDMLKANLPDPIYYLSFHFLQSVISSQ